MSREGWTYEKAGVSIDRGHRAVDRIRELARKTRRQEVVADVGGFAGVFRVGAEELVAGADGVGSKILVAEALNRWETIGVDLVAMNVNDILAQGAEPLFFLDYVAVGQIQEDHIAAIMSGIVQGCQQAGCALIGGETAEMPDVYGTHCDLAGFAVGRRVYQPPRAPQAGDVVIGLASSGFHSNGYQLIRRVLHSAGVSYDAPVAADSARSWGEVLLTPTVIYVGAVQTLWKSVEVLAMSHITGGGLVDNVPRTLGPAGVVLAPSAWPVPPAMQAIQTWGAISWPEMMRTFNLGIGFTIVVPPDQASQALEMLLRHGHQAYLIGTVVDQPGVQWA
jgi:phosphoribosylformylglycinamidine cyclo-ligase